MAKVELRTYGDGIDTRTLLTDLCRMNIGRNKPCHCGSGKKHKHCHGRPNGPPDGPSGAYVSPEIVQQFANRHAAEVRRRQQQGLGRPIISNVVEGYRMVAVGDRVHWSAKEHTFHDFLREFILLEFGEAWLVAEREKPLELQHQFMRWTSQAYSDYRRLAKINNGVAVRAPFTGAIMSFLGLAYNLYLTAHNVAVQEELIRRLKHRDNFWGALYETYVAAAFIKAGFEIEFENERNSDLSHCEFVATHKTTGKKFSVEAKARDAESQAERLAAIGKDPQVNFGIGNKLYRALKKRADYPRVIFIELSLPLDLDAQNIDVIAGIIESEVRPKEVSLNIRGEPAPPAYLFITNHPFHHRPDELATGWALIPMGFKIPNFGYGFSFNDFRDYVASREEHAAMYQLIKSISDHREIPSTFDGSMPELSFAKTTMPRLEIGRTYQFHDAEGNATTGKLESAIVDDAERVAICAYRTDAGFEIMASKLTDEEMSAYRRYPNTFFGRVEKQPRITRDICDPVPIFDQLYETYQNAFKEDLLDWFKGAFDIEDLKKLSQKDLAIEYCQACAWSIVGKIRR